MLAIISNQGVRFCLSYQKLFPSLTQWQAFGLSDQDNLSWIEAAER